MDKGYFVDEHKDTNASESELNAGLDLIYGLIFSAGSPEATELVKNNEQFSQIYDYLVELRQIVISFAKGDFTKDVKLRGFLGGSLKNLQANLRHLSWQVEIVAAGDFSQRVDFMGEFSTTFNSMVIRLHQSLEDLRQQEELLTAFTESLKQEIAVRIKAEEALRLSEERYRTLAALDPLTGQYNRCHFFNLALSEVARLKRNNGVITLCMLDVDFFKKFNDNYGHLNGDLCLQQLTKTAHSALRQMDIMGRYGGEEFIFLFPETGHEGGVQVAERLRSAIEETPIELDDGQMVGITVSIGVTVIEGSKITNKPDVVLREAVQLADAALYKAKAEGRNKVISSFDSD